MARLLLAGVLVGLLAWGEPARAADKDREAAKAALEKLNDYIGKWKGEGKPDTLKPEAKDYWKETLEWTWKFKGEDRWIGFTVVGGRYLSGGEVRYLVPKNRYELTLTDPKGAKRVFEGQLRKGRLTFQRVDDGTGATQVLTMNLGGDGVFLNYGFEEKPKGKTLSNRVYQVSAKKEGELLAGGVKKPECCVTGGLGTIAVSFGGKTYYVCCSGCRDVFNENPAKVVKAYEAKKAAGQ